MIPSFYNLEMLSSLYERYLADPDRLEPSWKYFFDGWQFAKSLEKPVVETGGLSSLIDAYRTYGHLIASFNPLKSSESPLPPQLDFEPTQEALAIVEDMKKIYCGKIGYEYCHGEYPEIEKWIQSQIEPTLKITFDKEERKKLLHDLNRAELFEAFIHTKYVGQKRFSLEGGETLIPMMSFLLEEAEKLSVSDVGIGMAHRGRLNVLANIFEKSYAHIFHEFEDHYSPDLSEGTGDVKYHKGFESKIRGMRLFLAANPSHLESVDPVVEGGVKALQVTQRKKPSEALPLLIHGDASIAGQGVIYETMQLMRLSGYGTGGTIHIVVNNQIGFTTLPKDGRSTRYCTDIAKTFSSPVFHVNAEDPEGCVAIALLAIRLRQKFGCDVFIDLNCYRKYGHNEGDEPAFTQPLEYGIIRDKKTIRDLYLEKLLAENLISSDGAHAMQEEFKKQLAKALMDAKAPTEQLHPIKQKAEPPAKVKTAVAASELKRLLKELEAIPKGFEVHPKILRILHERVNAPQVDWAAAEELSYATLLEEGVHVRISGQDSRRGTFSHRHGALIDQKNGAEYFPLSHLTKAKALFDIYNSPLSEFAVLGFDFGYSLEAKSSLVIWEAQYGDFCNGAQILIDQYLAASEQKWGIDSNITLFLPHGYEGGGPEHSSGRMERFLQLCAEENMRVANVTTPSQLFHLLRRQGLLPTRKPLILFTPKSFLRHPLVVSSFEEFEKGEFQPILDDKAAKNPTTLILCCGKMYYDLYLEREKRKQQDKYALVRIEMIHPFDDAIMKEILAKHSAAERILWAQEEPANMGAYFFLRPKIERLIRNRALEYVGREASASTAAGSYKLHKKQYESLVEQVFR
jgi:2-oxoglutarate dehydrogenase E1 component